MYDPWGMTVTRGSTYRDSLRWASSDCVFVPITDVSPAAPCVVVAPGHGLVDGWTARIESVRGMCLDGAGGAVRVLDPDTVEFPCLNALDAGVYRGSGTLVYHRPVDLTGYTARQQIRTRAGGDLLYEMTTENGRIEVDVPGCVIHRIIPAADTEAFEWRRGVFDLEMVQNDYVVKIDSGTVLVRAEVTVEEPV